MVALECNPLLTVSNDVVSLVVFHFVDFHQCLRHRTYCVKKVCVVQILQKCSLYLYEKNTQKGVFFAPGVVSPVIVALEREKLKLLIIDF